MKRTGNLFDCVVAFENLELACLKAFKGKNYSQRVTLLKNNLTEHINQLRNRLVNCEFNFGNYRRFVIYEPKRREINAPDLNEMIVHHAIMNICHRYFERKYIYHSYASRPHKGIHLAVKTVSDKAAGYEWYVKLDIKKYFDSIDHNRLKHMLYRMFKDVRLLCLMYSIIDSYEVDKEKGLPIGNLTSQYFANLYLSAVDHYMLTVCNAHAYCRYMDDVIFMDNDKERLKYLVHKYIHFCEEELSLKVKPPVIGKTSRGASFLGYKIYPGKICLNGKSKRRLRHKMIANYKLNISGKISDVELACKTNSLFAFSLKANTKLFRKSCLGIMKKNYKGFMS